MTSNLTEDIRASLSFWNRKLGRPQTAVEVWRSLPRPAALDAVAATLAELVLGGEFSEQDGFYAPLNASTPFSLDRRRQDFLADRKWRRLRVLARLFRHVPFFTFVFASGSIALGNVESRSDFDLLVGVRGGRMFLSRYLALALFLFRGVRRANDDEHSSPEKLCLNHLVTEAAYSKPPWNAYRRELYRNLVPLWGDEPALEGFRSANRVAGMPVTESDDLRRLKAKKSAFARAFEAVLGGRVGDWVERAVAAPIARRRLERYLARKGRGGRIVVSPDELEFHFNLRYE